MKLLKDFLTYFKGSLLFIGLVYLLFSFLYSISELFFPQIEANINFLQFALLIDVSVLIIYGIQKTLNYIKSSGQTKRHWKRTRNLNDQEIAVISYMYLNVSKYGILDINNPYASKLRKLYFITEASNMSTEYSSFQYILQPWLQDYLRGIIVYDENLNLSTFNVTRNRSGVVKKITINPNN